MSTGGQERVSLDDTTSVSTHSRFLLRESTVLPGLKVAREHWLSPHSADCRDNELQHCTALKNQSIWSSNEVESWRDTGCSLIMAREKQLHGPEV